MLHSLDLLWKTLTAVYGLKEQKPELRTCVLQITWSQAVRRVTLLPGKDIQFAGFTSQYIHAAAFSKPAI
jgi:hypothetical protein